MAKWITFCAGAIFSEDILSKHLFIESGNNKLKRRVLFFLVSMPIVLRRWPSERCWQCWLSLIASLSGSIVLRFCHRLFVFATFVVDIVHFFPILQHCVDNIWSSTIVRLLEGDSVFFTRKTLPSALGQSVNVNQLTLGLFLTQTWIHPHLFPYLLPFIQVACFIRKAFARIHFVSDLAERVHLVDCVSNSEQNFDINISYNSDQAFFIIQLRIILIVPFAWSILFPTRLRGLTHILGRHEICQKI